MLAPGWTARRVRDVPCVLSEKEPVTASERKTVVLWPLPNVDEAESDAACEPRAPEEKQYASAEFAPVYAGSATEADTAAG